MERIEPKPPAPKFSLLTQITRQKRKLATIESQIGQMMTRRVDAEEKLAELYRQHAAEKTR